MRLKYNHDNDQSNNLRVCRRALLFFIFLSSYLIISPKPAVSQIPQVINYQGKLTDSSNSPGSGQYSIQFSLYESITGGNSLWSETQPSVQVVNGIFSAQLGSVTPIPESVFDQKNRFLEISVNGETLSPRQKLLSSPFAFNALRLDGKSATNYISAESNGNVGLNRINPVHKLEVGGRIGLIAPAPLIRLWDENAPVNNRNMQIQNSGGHIIIGSTFDTYGWKNLSNGVFFFSNDGKLGIGNNTPSEKLDVNGKISATPVFGSWHPANHGPNTTGNQHILVNFDVERVNTDPSYFTNLGGQSGIRVEKSGYYQITARALVFLGGTNDYGHFYLRRNGINIEIDHGEPGTGVHWADRHCDWKGFLNAGDIIQVNIYHQGDTTRWYHMGPIYTRLTIHKMN